MAAPIIARPEGVWPDGTLPPYAAPSVSIAAYAGTDGAVELTVRGGNGALLSGLASYDVRLCITGRDHLTPAISGSAALFTLPEDIAPGHYTCQFEAISASGMRSMLTRKGSLSVRGTQG
jgi:hypothetical protein